MNLELDKKIALITGSSSGIGYAIAQGLQQEGAEVVLNGRDVSRLNAAAVSLSNCLSIPGDVIDFDQCEGVIDQLIEQKGQLDILVCNVGSGASVPPGTEVADEWRRMMDVNLISATNMVRAAREALAESQGTVLCISSICGSAALGCPIAYAGAKAALNSYVVNIARPLAKDGIRINVLSPGNILFEGSVWERKLAENESEVKAMLEKEVALGRLGTANEVADMAGYLVSSRSSFATGAVYVLDGGQLRA